MNQRLYFDSIEIGANAEKKRILELLEKEASYAKAEGFIFKASVIKEMITLIEKENKNA